MNEDSQSGGGTSGSEGAVSDLIEAPTPSARARTREELADYLLDIGAVLAAYGCPSYRLEDVIRLIADVEGYRADPFALPTGLFVRVTTKDGSGPQVQRMTRVSDWGVDLARLTMVDEIFNAVVDRRSTIEQARARIREVMARPPEYSKAIVFAATVVVSGSAAVFFQGGPLDVLVAAIVGGVHAPPRRGGGVEPGVGVGLRPVHGRHLVVEVGARPHEIDLGGAPLQVSPQPVAPGPVPGRPLRHGVADDEDPRGLGTR